MNIAGRMLWMHLKLPRVTVSVQPREDSRGFIFEVTSVVDLGSGRRMGILKSLSHAGRSIKNNSWVQEPVKLPWRIDGLEFIFTAQSHVSPLSIEKTMAAHFHGQRPQAITQAVLMPGDLMVFRETRDGRVIPEAYRVPQLSQRQTEDIQHAL